MVMAPQRSPSRVAAGVPTGGQFAGHDRPEAGSVTLSEPDIAKVVEAARTSAGYWARRYGCSSEDLASETLLAWWGARSRANSDAPIRDADRYITRTARNMAAQTVAGAARTEDRQAYVAYNKRWAELAQRSGRTPSASECAEMASAIRMAQPPGRRAREGFHNRHPRDVELNPNIARAANEETSLDPSPVGERMVAVENLAAIRGRDNLEEARKRVWDAMAERRGTPMVVRASIADRAAASARKTVRSGGGAAAVGRRWMAGTCSPAEAAGLFAPFGPKLDEDGRDKVVELILAAPAHADDLWDASVAAATAPRPNQVRGALRVR